MEAGLGSLSVCGAAARESKRPGFLYFDMSVFLYFLTFILLSVSNMPKSFKAWARAQRPGWWVHRPSAPLLRATAITSVRCLSSDVNSVFLDLYFPYLVFSILIVFVFCVLGCYLFHYFFCVCSSAKLWVERSNGVVAAPGSLPLTVGQKVQTTTNCSSPSSSFLSGFMHFWIYALIRVCILWLCHWTFLHLKLSFCISGFLSNVYLYIYIWYELLDRM